MLQTRVGEMKAELSYTSEHIEQLLGMMQQLLRAKSADGGQQKDMPGGSDRRDANDDSGGAGKAKEPRFKMSDTSTSSEN